MILSWRDTTLLFVQSQYKRHKRLTKQWSLTANIQRYTLISFISYCLTYCASTCSWVSHIAIRHVVTQYSSSQFAGRSIVWQHKEPLPRILQYKQIYRLFLLDRKYDTFTIYKIVLKTFYQILLLLHHFCYKSTVQTDLRKYENQQQYVALVFHQGNKTPNTLADFAHCQKQDKYAEIPTPFEGKWGVFFSAQVAHTSTSGASL